MCRGLFLATSVLLLLLLLLLLLSNYHGVAVVVAYDASASVVPFSTHRALEFGDFAEDVPEECPATTSCPVVCVATVFECPQQTAPSLCATGMTLCRTGHCAADCSIHNTAYRNPCEKCDSLSVACPKVIDVYPNCRERFGDFYDAHDACVAAQVESVPKISFWGPWFVAFYASYAALFIVVTAWCWYNERYHPMESIATLEFAVPNATCHETWTQTGYRTCFIGTAIYILLEASFVMIQLLLLVTTILYYVQQGAISTWKAVIPDEVQVLQAFQLVWMFGFVWCFWFRYPSTSTTGLYTLFLRRCELGRATHVAFVAPVRRRQGRNSADSSPAAEAQSRIGMAASFAWRPIDFILRIMFSYRYGQPGMETTFCRVDVAAATNDHQSQTKSIQHRMRRLTLDETLGMFVPYGVNEKETTIGEMLTRVGGLSNEEAAQRLDRHGDNAIALPQPSVLATLCHEFDKPFYLYQNFTVWVFANFWFYFMAIIFTLVRITGALVVTYFQYQNDCLLYKLTQVEGSVEVCRDGSFCEISARYLVAGDVVVLKAGEVHGDMVVLGGSRLLVDESALSGEATPVQKEAVDSALRNQVYASSKHISCTLSAGTRILEDGGHSEPTLALVTATGSYTRKGALLTDVLANERHHFKFDDEVKAVLLILALEAVVMIWLVYHFLDNEPAYAWFYAMYVLATVFPPLLPTVFVVSVAVSAKRLQEKRISCPHPEAILLAGKVDYAFFDKTGTMTRQGLDFISCDESEPGDFVRTGMAVCHSLTSTGNGELIGTQVDLSLFNASGGTMSTNMDSAPLEICFSGRTYRILKRFEFDCHTATQSVIVADDSGKRHVFVKGSPEAIKTLCLPNSVPESFDTIVRLSAKAGIYQLAMAHSVLELKVKTSAIARDDVEGSLTFAGFINLQNCLRSETPSVLEELAESNTATAMITGDNVLTGIYAARESGMIRPNRTVFLARTTSDKTVEFVDADCEAPVERPTLAFLRTHGGIIDLAMTGEAWNELRKADPKYLASIMPHIRVFGRCKPADKVSVVEAFAASGYTTLMCGDGQNDCGCLKAAHVGVALSSAEASVVAPFTSLDKTLLSVVQVLREGRCAVASAISSYSYYIVYGQSETFLQVIAAYFSVTFSEWCWVFVDGVWSISFAFSIPLSKPTERLAPRRPNDSLFGSETLLSVCGILALNLVFLAIALFALFNQTWFQCRKWNLADISSAITIGDNYESSVLFLVGGYQFVAAAIVLSFGYVFRRAWYKNRVVLFLSALWTLFIIVMTVVPSSFSCIWRVNCDNEE